MVIIFLVDALIFACSSFTFIIVYSYTLATVFEIYLHWHFRLQFTFFERLSLSSLPVSAFFLVCSESPLTSSYINAFSRSFSSFSARRNSNFQGKNYGCQQFLCLCLPKIKHFFRRNELSIEISLNICLKLWLTNYTSSTLAISSSGFESSLFKPLFDSLLKEFLTVYPSLTNDHDTKEANNNLWKI